MSNRAIANNLHDTLIIVHTATPHYPLRFHGHFYWHRGLSAISTTCQYSIHTSLYSQHAPIRHTYYIPPLGTHLPSPARYCTDSWPVTGFNFFHCTLTLLPTNESVFNAFHHLLGYRYRFTQRSQVLCVVIKMLF